MIAVGLQYLGGAPVGRAVPADRATPSRPDPVRALQAEVARREQMVAVLEELEARRLEVRELRTRLGLPASGDAPMAAAARTRGPSRGARWVQAPWMRALIAYGVPAAYLLVIVLGEILTVVGAAPVGMLLGLALLAILPLHATFAGCRQRGLLTAMTLLPLIRVLTLALPLGSLTLAGAYLLSGSAVLLGAGAMMWALGLSPRAIGLRVGNPLVQAGIALIGIPLGLVQYGVLGPPALAADGGMFAVSALVLLVCVALAEEVVYRGILQTAAMAALGRVGVVYAGLVFAAGYLGNGSAASAGLALGVGLLFSFVRARTGSLLGVTVAHGVALALSMLVWPLVVGAMR
jgi:membrane protease YdiL (CAAX protease family)